VFTGLAILGDTSFELTSATSNDKNGTIGLGSTSDHVLNEITMTRGIDHLQEEKCIRFSFTSRVSQKRQAPKHTVTMNFGVSNFQRAISMVIPRSRSAFSLSSTQAIRAASEIK